MPLNYCLTRERTLSATDILPTGYEGACGSDPRQCSTSNTRAKHSLPISIHPYMYNVGNVSSFNTFNVAVYQNSWWVQPWLSPLEPRKKHQDVSNKRLDGIGEWVLQRDEFTSWSNGQDNTVNSTLLCYGDQGVGKTYIR